MGDPERPEGIYQPKGEDYEKAKEVMTDTEKMESSVRERALAWQKQFSQKSENYLQFLDASEEEKIDLEAENAGEETLKTLYGEGLPTGYIYHDFGAGYNMTYLVAPHNFWTPMGQNLANVVEQGGGSEEEISAAKVLVDTYNDNCERIISKSETLQKIIAPLKRGWDTEITDEELEYLGKVGMYVKTRDKGQSKPSQYLDAVEPQFGKIFRRVALRAETSEEFNEYQTKINQAMTRLSGKE